MGRFLHGGLFDTGVYLTFRKLRNIIIFLHAGL